MQPVIGVTRGSALRPTYRRALEAAGAAVVEIGPETPHGRAAAAGSREALEGLNGVLLTGGGDIDPAHYGAPSRHPSVRIEPDRDAMELALARAALAEGIPLLGICRGIQSLNVALGGTLWQDLPSERPGPVVHQDPPENRDRSRLLHTVDVAAGSRLAEIVGAGTLPVNSIHHQAIRTLGAGLRPVATAPDGIVEAVQADTTTFALAVQWHPEDLWQAHLRHAALFSAFCAAAAARGAP